MSQYLLQMSQDNVDEDVVLLFSKSFSDGAILTKDAFFVFLKVADRAEREDFQYSIISAFEAAHTEYEFYNSTSIKEELLKNLNTH